LFILTTLGLVHLRLVARWTRVSLVVSPTSVLVTLSVASYDRRYARHRHRPQTSKSQTSELRHFLCHGFYQRQANCACAKWF